MWGGSGNTEPLSGWLPLDRKGFSLTFPASLLCIFSSLVSIYWPFEFSSNINKLLLCKWWLKYCLKWSCLPKDGPLTKQLTLLNCNTKFSILVRDSLLSTGKCFLLTDLHCYFIISLSGKLTLEPYRNQIREQGPQYTFGFLVSKKMRLPRSPRTDTFWFQPKEKLVIFLWSLLTLDCLVNFFFNHSHLLLLQRSNPICHYRVGSINDLVWSRHLEAWRKMFSSLVLLFVDWTLVRVHQAQSPWSPWRREQETPHSYRTFQKMSHSSLGLSWPWRARGKCFPVLILLTTSL